MSEELTRKNTISNNSNYDKYLSVWNLVDDCIEGMDTIKQRGVRYLPMTEGMAADKVMGQKIYERYKHNALFPEYTHDFFIASTGLLKQKDPVFNFPDVMDDEFVPCPSYSTNKTLYDVYSEVQDEVMKYCRCGVLLDVPNTMEKNVHQFPVLLVYNTYKIFNWGYTNYNGRNILSWVLLNESYYSYENETFSPELKENYRFLGLKTRDSLGNPLKEPMYYTYTMGQDIRGIFNPPLPDDDGITYTDDGVEIRYPHIQGRTMNHIPFYCFTGTGLSIEPERPLVQSLCNACISLYGLYADYREYLYKQGFGILFGSGFTTNDSIYSGVNKAILIESDNANLKMVESSGNGLAEYRLAVQNAELYAKSLGLALLKSTGDETGVSVAKRQGFKTASLKSISKTVGEGFTLIAKDAALWAGLSQEAVDSITIVPNVDFSATAENSEMSVFQNIANADTLILSPYDVFQNLKALGKTVYATYDEYKEAVDEAQREKDRYELEKKLKEMKETNTLNLKNQIDTTKAMNELNATFVNATNNGNVNDDSSDNTAVGNDEGKARNKESGDNSKKIICVETGKTYENATEAGKDVGVSGSAITRALRGSAKTAGISGGRKLHWKYV